MVRRFAVRALKDDGLGRVMMERAAGLGALVALVLVSAATLASPRPPSAAPAQSRCPDQHLLAKDLLASRSALQPNGASQTGSPWIPLDALLLRTPEQRRDFMLKTIEQQFESRHSTLDLQELERVLGAMRQIDREKFLPSAERTDAYLPLSLDIGFCQTLSDPYIIALMLSAADVGPRANVLDVGTGSGYQAAILSRLSAHVQSLEIVPQLAAAARKRLKHLGYRNVDVELTDGYAGWPPRAPFDVIIVAAGSTSIPQPLLDQLKPGGRLIMPIGRTALEEELVLATKSATGALTRCTLGLAAFVPMTGHAQTIAHENAPSHTRDGWTSLPRCYGAPVT